MKLLRVNKLAPTLTEAAAAVAAAFTSPEASRSRRVFFLAVPGIILVVVAVHGQASKLIRGKTRGSS